MYRRKWKQIALKQAEEELLQSTRLEIHLFDKVAFLSHNAVRAPGAASLDELRAQQKKVHYFQKLYSQMRHGIIAQGVVVNADTIHLLREMKFVFICIDYPLAKKLIIERLEE